METLSIDRILRGHDLFRSLGADQAKELSSWSAVKNYDAQETVFEYNSKAKHVYMLMEGSVNLRLPPTLQGFSLVISRIEKGELFGLSPLLGSTRYTATAQCIEPTALLLIETQPFRRLLEANCLVGFHMMNRVANIYFTRYIEVLKSLQGVVSQIALIR